jgi:hypothetical protein
MEYEPLELHLADATPSVKENAGLWAVCLVNRVNRWRITSESNDSVGTSLRDETLTQTCRSPGAQQPRGREAQARFRVKYNNSDY